MSENIDESGGSTPFGDDAQEEAVRQIGRTDKDGASVGHFTLTPASDTRPKELLCDVRPIIPVIFLPGVMGSPLVHATNGDDVFFPPNTDGLLGKAGALPALIGMWFRGASSRETLYDPTTTMVTPFGPVLGGKRQKGDNDDQYVDAEEARRRGWGSVYRSSYQPMLAWLEQQLNEPKHLGKTQGVWNTGDPEGKSWTFKPLLDTEPADYGATDTGAQGRGQKITEDSEVFKHFLKYRYRVYAIGYNWLQSNEKSAKDVIEGLTVTDKKTKETMRLMGIKEILEENHSGKAIILTHSMGGLVARMAIAMHGAADLMHGVFHNVLPATGAPLAAKRFRTGGGSEGGIDGFINGALLGSDAGEFTAVAANAPGPLELLPMPDYHNGEPWWIFSRLNGDPVMKLPKEGNAYKEIFANSKWYGLVPAESESLLDPAGIVKERLDKTAEKPTVSENFRDTMSQVVVNQNKIINIYHDKTYVCYGNGALKSRGSPASSEGDGKPTIEKSEKLESLLAWGTVIWKGNIPEGVTEEELRSARFMHDSHSGTLRVHLDSRNVTIEFEVQKVAKLPPGNDKPDPDKNGIIPGDGTVPVWSAEAPARGVGGGAAPGVQIAFDQGGYVHQESYNHPWARWALLYSIVQIAQDAPEC
ncbi:esterase/lipase family protein [Burkholderia multivorans]|uniref:esterase/lipase family protein n=1 Tax=Burkholderia multivorans TaxID=87883 RepID=UPI002018A2BC|nr:alpha/beta hydrolase [Burkholderia multivorans]MCL4627696.1 alpha/beta hydrolase [Burkholderia multivorans]MCO1390807.1 alpha/beta hydrolase [Burkholderia multivorans]UQO13067.1 alpha/beta hydrolase [Burkholderia multivorans]UQO55309.1 alpha/beta hydrolase [Burkholderia multivorans]UQO63802.1 alpha/beta hydrolase [Burkholderia multivorans]